MKIQIDAVRYLILIEFFFLLISFVLGVLLNMVFLLSHALIIPSIKNGCDAKVKNPKKFTTKNLSYIFNLLKLEFNFLSETKDDNANTKIDADKIIAINISLPILALM